MSGAAATRLDPWRRSAAATAGLYLHFVRLAFLKFLAYRLRYYTGVISYTIFVAGYYYLYRALYASRAPGPGGVAEMGGLTVGEMITYVAVGWIGRSFYFNNIGRDLMHQVREGQIAMQLIKPYDVQSVMMFEAAGEAVFRLVMFTVPITVVIVPLFGVHLPPQPVLLGWTVLSFTLSLVVYSQLNFLVGCLAFHMKNIDGVLRAKMVSGDFLAGVIVPFSFFPEWFQRVVEWLPFQAIGYLPVMIYLGKRPGDELWQALLVQAGWAVGLWLAGRVAFRRSLRQVVVQGG
ncbi:MAG: ABC-2 family transporter protein [Krumholzibacteria bacterium]|nr:ABC-2 family transporter protein [Candidatus Krumholzibacteria bacterium]